MKQLKRTSLILCLIVVLIIFFNECFAMTQEEAGQIIAQFAINFCSNYQNQTTYSCTGACSGNERT